MNKKILGALCAMGLSMPTSAAELVLDKSLIENGSVLKWAPEDVKLKFVWTEGSLSRYVAKFWLNRRTLFDSWKVIDDDGVTHRFPFVLESTLTIPKAAQINGLGGLNRVAARAEKEDDYTRGVHWEGKMGTNGACFYSGQTYHDIPVLDFVDYKDPTKIGIGFYGLALQDSPVQVAYYIDLNPRKLLITNPSSIDTQLRFRLNVDVRLLKKYGVTKSQIEQHFRLGIGWEGFEQVGFNGYNHADLSNEPTPQEIARHYSFSIEAVKDGNGNEMSNAGLISLSNLCPLSNTDFENCTSD